MSQINKFYKQNEWIGINKSFDTIIQIICYPWQPFRFLPSSWGRMMIVGYPFRCWWSHQPNIRRWSYGFSLSALWLRYPTSKWLSWFFSLVRRQRLAFWQHLHYRFWLSLLLDQQVGWLWRRFRVGFFRSKGGWFRRRVWRFWWPWLSYQCFCRGIGVLRRVFQRWGQEPFWIF